LDKQIRERREREKIFEKEVMLNTSEVL